MCAEKFSNQCPNEEEELAKRVKKSQRMLIRRSIKWKRKMLFYPRRKLNVKVLQCGPFVIWRSKDILSLMRLLRLKFNDEQLHIPVVQYFRENLPNLAVVRNEDDTHEVKRKEADGNLSTDQFNGRNLHVSLLRQLSMAYPDCSNAIPSFGGFESSSKSVKTTLFGAENMQIKQFVLEDPSDTQMFELQDTLQTPDVNNNPLSVGMTPKTLEASSDWRSASIGAWLSSWRIQGGRHGTNRWYGSHPT